MICKYILASENGTGSGEWSSLHDLPQMSLTDKIIHQGPHKHIPLEQFKPASLGEIRNYEMKVSSGMKSYVITSLS